MPNQKLKTVRRSVALPRELMDDVLSVAPPKLKGNLNRLVVVSLRDFVARRRAEAFGQAMAEMAADQASSAPSAPRSRGGICPGRTR